MELKPKTFGLGQAAERVPGSGNVKTSRDPLASKIRAGPKFCLQILEAL